MSVVDSAGAAILDAQIRVGSHLAHLAPTVNGSVYKLLKIGNHSVTVSAEEYMSQTQVS